MHFYKPSRFFPLATVWFHDRLDDVDSNLVRRICLMSLHNHLVELERRHKALEKKLEDAKNHPATDGLQLLELKRKKLALRDEIEKLRVKENLTTLH